MIAQVERPALTSRAICDCFNRLFGVRYRVRLCGGGAEPEYVPPRGATPGCIIAREDFAASALHEAAHWCVAGVHRRTLADYGYNYLPPPRGELGQRRFFDYELRVQAVECYLAAAAGLAFRASADDPDYSLERLADFEASVRGLAAGFVRAESIGSGKDSGVHAACASDSSPAAIPPPRAARFAQALRLARSHEIASA